MAQSRLEKIGTIFTRTKGLIRAGALKTEDRPMWYDVYEAFPPAMEPRYDRPAQKIPIRKIFYEDDVLRAKFHKSVKNIGATNLADDRTSPSATQQFIEIYKNLKAQGPLDEQKIFETAKDMLQEKLQLQREARGQMKEDSSTSTSLLENYSEAKKATTFVAIKDIFND